MTLFPGGANQLRIQSSSSRMSPGQTSRQPQGWCAQISSFLFLVSVVVWQYFEVNFGRFDISKDTDLRETQKLKQKYEVSY